MEKRWLGSAVHGVACARLPYRHIYFSSRGSVWDGLVRAIHYMPSDTGHTNDTVRRAAVNTRAYKYPAVSFDVIVVLDFQKL